MTNERHIHQEMQKIASLIGTARRLLSEGRSVDLSAVEGHVERLCDSVLCLPTETARGLSPALQVLIETLDELGQELSSHHAAPVCDPPPRRS